ncbi:MAG TPA: aminodeoxychorismate synthase component I [Acidimicrobiales bacterium]|nr:aminodeoxychorismate synthase component I [Acidimicrobiales bacterium]
MRPAVPVDLTRDPGGELTSAHPMRRPVKSALTPAEVLRACRADVRPFCLTGEWAGGGALVGSDPVRVADPELDDPFELLGAMPAIGPPRDGGPAGFVGGGWFGWLGYGLGRRIERLPDGPPRPHPLAPAGLAFHDHLLRWDRTTSTWWFEALVTEERAAELDRRFEVLRARLAAAAPPIGHPWFGPFRSRPSRHDHLGAVTSTLSSIHAGDIYQANLCVRLEADVEGSLLDAFANAASALAPAYGAYVCDANTEIASFSPELFLRRHGRDVRSSPIKGTVRRDADLVASTHEREQLERSAKDRAENVMIVDLVRNDLGRVCRPGTVEVPDLARVEAHPGVWHLVSDVVGTLADGRDDGDLVRACFPPGSVTGAPKVRAMEIIAATEATGREVYTGAIGYASPVAGLELNVAIRTFERTGDRVWFGVGGGVVVDSTPEGEWAECLVKAEPLLRAVGADLDEPVAAAGAR